MLEQFPAALARIAAAETAREAAALTLAAGETLLGATGGLIARVISDAELEVLAVTGIQSRVVEPGDHAPRSIALPITDAVRAGGPIVVDHNDRRIAQYPLLAAVPLPGAMTTIAYPLIAEGSTVGGLSLYVPVAGAAIAAVEPVVAALARTCGETVARILRAEAARAAQTANAVLQRQREALVAGILHDLRSPLTAIKGEAQLLRRQAARLGTPEGEQLVAGLEHLDAIASRMNQMLTDLASATTSDRSEQPASRRRSVDLAALVRAGVREALAGDENRTIQVVGSTEELTGTWDGDGLERVIANLLSNALKYSPSTGEVTVTLVREPVGTGATAVLSVRDNGIGIPAGDLPHIFDPYYRAGNVASRTPGMGIGLTGAKQIVEQHGGTLTASSVEGEGATFTVCLPLERQP